MNNGIYYNKSASIPERERSQPAKRFVSFIYILLFALSLLRAEKEPSFAYLFNGSRTTLREGIPQSPDVRRRCGELYAHPSGDSSELGRDGTGPAGGPLCTAGYGMGCGLYPNALGTAVGGVEAQRSGSAGQHRGAPSIWRPVLAAGRWKNGDHDHGVIRYRRTV